MTEHSISNSSVATAATRNHNDARFSCNICFEAVVEPVVTHCGHLYCWPCLYRWLEPGMSAMEQNDVFGFIAAAATRSTLNRSRRTCPVCKSPCTVKSVVPVYVRSSSSSSNSSEYLPRSQRVQQSEGIHEDRAESPITVEDVHDEREGAAQQETEEDEFPLQGTTEPTQEHEVGNTGLRRRLRFQQPPDSIPARPQYSPSATPDANADPDAASIALRGGISRGLGVSLQEAFFQGSTIPSLHHPPLDEELEDPTATRFLSRLLLMLGSFVVLCLLLF